MWRFLAATLVLLGLSLPCAAAVAFDNTAECLVNGGANTSISCSFTVGSGSNRALVAFLSLGNQAVTSLGCTYNSVSLGTALGTVNTSTGNGRIDVFAMVAPASGANTFACSWTTGAELKVGLSSWTNVDQTGGATSFPNFTSGVSAIPATQSLTITSATGHAAVAGWVNAVNLINSVDNIQLYLDSVNGTFVDGASNWAAGAAMVTLSATYNSTCGIGCAGAGIDILASAGGGATAAPGLTLMGIGP